ncbi:MAG: hypothetical protein ACI4GW_09610 [Lachnospiraceae bacterium]
MIIINIFLAVAIAFYVATCIVLEVVKKSIDIGSDKNGFNEFVGKEFDMLHEFD